MTHSLFAKKTCPKSTFPGYPSLSHPNQCCTAIDKARRKQKKTQHCPGGAGEGAIFAVSLKSTLKDKSVSTILKPIVCLSELHSTWKLITRRILRYCWITVWMTYNN